MSPRTARGGADDDLHPRGSAVLLDTGVLVALYARDDPRHEAATRWLGSFGGALHTVEPVLTEAAHFLPATVRPALAELAAGGRVHVHHLDASAYRRMAHLLRKYGDRDADWAGIALVWLAERLDLTHIATLDVSDFSVYRIHERKRFRLVPLT